MATALFDKAPSDSGKRGRAAPPRSHYDKCAGVWDLTTHVPASLLCASTQRSARPSSPSSSPSAASPAASYLRMASSCRAQASPLPTEQARTPLHLSPQRAVAHYNTPIRHPSCRAAALHPPTRAHSPPNQPTAGESSIWQLLQPAAVRRRGSPSSRNTNQLVRLLVPRASATISSTARQRACQQQRRGRRHRQRWKLPARVRRRRRSEALSTHGHGTRGHSTLAAPRLARSPLSKHGHSTRGHSGLPARVRRCRQHGQSASGKQLRVQPSCTGCSQAAAWLRGAAGTCRYQLVSWSS